MRPERLLLLWDDLDDFVGITRHGILNAAHAFTSFGRDAAGSVSRWITRADLAVSSLGDPSSES